VVILGVIVLIIAGGAVLAARAFRSDPFEEALTEDRVASTLFVFEREGMPVSIFTVFYYPATERAAVFGMPGSVGILLKSLGRVGRIDEVYDRANLAPFKEAVEIVLGTSLSFSLALDMPNLGKLVDLAGGVEVFIPDSVDALGEGGERLLFPSGITKLDGEKAPEYLAYELPGEDEDVVRTRRRRLFLGLLKSLSGAREVLASPEGARLLYSFLRTDMDRKMTARLFGEFARIDTERTGVQAVEGNERTVDGRVMLLPYYSGGQVREMVSKSLAGLVSAGAGDRVYTVEVLNGTGAAGLAGRTADMLRGFGYRVTGISNADRQNYRETVIVNRTGIESAAQEFGKVIACGNIREETPAGTEAEAVDAAALAGTEPEAAGADFTLILGHDFNGRYVISR